MSVARSIDIVANAGAPLVCVYPGELDPQIICGSSDGCSTVPNEQILLGKGCGSDVSCCDDQVEVKE